MKLKSFSFLLIFFIFFSLFTCVYATENNYDEGFEEHQEEITVENEDEIEFEENNEEDIKEIQNEENQEEETENISTDYSETLEEISSLLDRIDKSLSVLAFFFALLIIIDTVRHSFFRERR